MEALLNYYIIDRKNGVSYDPFSYGGKTGTLKVYSSIAPKYNPFIINVKRLIKGLKEKRYRLVSKTNK